MRHRVVLVALTLAFSGSAGAQETTGRLDGRVTAEGHVPLAGVELTLTSAAVLGQRSVVTDAHGRFALTALPVGSYRLSARKLGFRPVAVEDVPIRLGTTTSLPEVSLTAAVVELPEITITARAAGYDANNTAQQLILGSQQLDALPLERNFRDIVLLASSGIPSFLGAGYGGAGINRDGANIGGATGYENRFFVDGINITSPIRGETSIDLPYNFIQQVDVRTGGSLAEDGQALGGAVNVVTPTGSNRLRGQLFGFFSNDALETRARPVNGYYQTGFTYYDIGGSLTGPIVRDRLWFSTSYDGNYERRDNSFAFGPLADTKQQHLFSGKLSWLVSPRTSGALTILGDPTRSKPLAGPLFGNGIPQNAEVLQRRDEAGGLGVSVRSQRQLTQRILLEASVSQMTRLEKGEPATPAGRAPVVIDETNGTLYGGHGFGYRFDSRRRSVNVDASWQLASHAFKWGAQYEELFGDISIDIDRGSMGGTITRVAADRYDWHWNNTRNGRGYNRDPALYVQDGWQLTRRVLLNAGLRWSRQDLSAERADVAHRRIRIDDGAQPRFGVVWQPGVLGTQRVFASYARAVEQLPVWGHQSFGTGAESLAVFPRDPRIDMTGGVFSESGVNGGGNGFDTSGVRGHAQDTWTVGYNRRVWGARALTLAVMRRSLVRAIQAGLDTTGTYIVGNPGFGAMTELPRARRTYDAVEATLDQPDRGSGWFRVSYVLSRTRGNDPGLYGSDWRLGFTNFGPLWLLPEQNGTGLLPNDRTHLLKAFGARQLGRGLSVGSSLIVASGTPLSEYGGHVFGAPFRAFASPRGTSGRTPAIWDLGVRVSYALPAPSTSSMRTQILLDVQHLGSPRRAVDVEQWHFTCVDANGGEACPNAGYGRVLQYQRPMMARLGVQAYFGERQ